MVWEAVADGSLSEEYLQRFAKEYYFLGRWYTSEFGSLVANAPDTDAVSLAASEHFAHWLQNLADETGYTGDANHVDMKIEWAHQLGITDDELDSYVPLPETIGTVFTTPLLHAPLLRGGPGRLRLGGRALRGVDGVRPEDVRGHARPLRASRSRTSASTPTRKRTTASRPTTCCARWPSPPTSSAASGAASCTPSRSATNAPWRSTAGSTSPASSGSGADRGRTARSGHRRHLPHRVRQARRGAGQLAPRRPPRLHHHAPGDAHRASTPSASTTSSAGA